MEPKFNIDLGKYITLPTVPVVASTDHTTDKTIIGAVAVLGALALVLVLVAKSK